MRWCKYMDQDRLGHTAGSVPPASDREKCRSVLASLTVACNDGSDSTHRFARAA